MPPSRLGAIPTIPFYSRWLPSPLYLGPIVVPAGIHVTFLFSALAIAAVDRVMPEGRSPVARAAAGRQAHRTH